MDITTVSAPSPGTAKPGNLYTDLQSKQIWLGVDPVVDPAGAVLISDIVALQAADATMLANAKTYTDGQITTRAPTVHTHTANQITDFNGAVTSVVAGIPGANWVKGMIMIWSGSLAEIGVGDLAGWTLCDGSNGSPDLRDRFIIGAGNKAVGAVNTITSFSTSLAGAHLHTIGTTVLATSQIPAHQHTVQVYGSGTFNTSDQSTNHTHAGDISGRALVSYAGGSGGQGTSGGGFTTAANTNWNDRGHYHAVTVGFYSSGTSDATGSGGGHTHTCASAGDHQHTITTAQLRESTPYYAMAFIMKL